MQADLVLKKELRILQLDIQTAERPLQHFLQQSHTCSNKATPYGPIGIIFIQITTVAYFRTFSCLLGDYYCQDGGCYQCANFTMSSLC